MSLELAIQQNTEAVLALTKIQQANYEQGEKAISLTESLLKRMHGDSATNPADVMDASVVRQLNAQTEKPKKAKPAKLEEPVSTTDALPAPAQCGPNATSESFNPEPVKAPEPVKVAAPITATNVTLADLQAEGKKLLDANRQHELKRVVTDLKGTKLSLLPASDYPAALKALKALTAGL